MYRAASLPTELRGSPPPNMDAINLGNVSGFGFASTRVDVGDLLKYTITTGRDGERTYPVQARVDEDGSIEVPLVGRVQVAGLEPVDAANKIAKAGVDRQIYVQPQCSMEIASKAVNRITVLGAVPRPGVKELPRATSDLVSALAAAGGLRDDASTFVEITRQRASHMAANDMKPNSVAEGQEGAVAQAAWSAPSGSDRPADSAEVQQTAAIGATRESVGAMAVNIQKIDLEESQSLTANECELGDRDVVMVMPREKELVHVGGLVRKPGQFALPANRETRLLDAIAMAGGESSPVADKILILRTPPGASDPIAIRASIATAKENARENLILMTGDMVTVEQTASTIVVDTLGRFFRASLGLSGRTALF